ncbi:hypothetical protein PR001_g16041 [Phytophthora rubi]|uniref:Uncharacterized protein n=1 Tax=Phytophthora rubi TaxID=129364 RepID=A0A6A3KHM7_9STRA|nr:hypothetical protein PR002_g16355 [Phytophthora rubi]KAE9010939.1 hypothetical protein PR001_g16041 [Phytophthora rubi]
MDGAQAFVGDGNYVGDGGELLQRLWEFASWKMIRNCPGRYIIKHKKQAPFLIDGVAVTAIDSGDFVRRALATSEGEVPTIAVHNLVSPRCVDRIKVVVFGAEGSGGGVITYCKQETISSDEAQDGAAVYVHTLNTASGLRRKLRGLQIDHVLKVTDDNSEMDF